MENLLIRLLFSSSSSRERSSLKVWGVETAEAIRLAGFSGAEEWAFLLGGMATKQEERNDG
jgi:hypothetical protein